MDTAQKYRRLGSFALLIKKTFTLPFRETKSFTHLPSSLAATPNILYQRLACRFRTILGLLEVIIAILNLN